MKLRLEIQAETMKEYYWLAKNIDEDKRTHALVEGIKIAIKLFACESDRHFNTFGGPNVIIDYVHVEKPEGS